MTKKDELIDDAAYKAGDVVEVTMKNVNIKNNRKDYDNDERNKKNKQKTAGMYR